MELVYVCSPFYNEDSNVMSLNVKRAERIMKSVVQNGGLPIYTPFLLTHAGLNDREHREQIMNLCLEYLRICNCMWVYENNGKLSNGQQIEMDLALTLKGLDIVFIDENLISKEQ